MGTGSHLGPGCREEEMGSSKSEASLGSRARANLRTPHGGGIHNKMYHLEKYSSFHEAFTLQTKAVPYTMCFQGQATKEIGTTFPVD